MNPIDIYIDETYKSQMDSLVFHLFKQYLPITCPVETGRVSMAFLREAIKVKNSSTSGPFTSIHLFQG